MEKEKKYKKECEVCSQIIDVDVYGQGGCPNCGWWNCFLNEENPSRITMPNLVSLNKAIKLYKEGKPFEPNFDEFIEDLHSYGEMQFVYNGVLYAVELVCDEDKKTKIQLFNSQTKQSQFFENGNEFKNNAKIGSEYLRNIWEQTTDRYWLQ